MNISQILNTKGRDVISVRSGTSLKEIADVLTENDIGAAVVLTDEDRMCGIVSERDVIRHISEGGIASLSDPVSCRMTSDVISSDGHETVDEAMALMSDHRFRHLPVIEEGQLVGLISIGDVVKQKIAETVQDAEDLKRYIAS